MARHKKHKRGSKPVAPQQDPLTPGPHHFSAEDERAMRQGVRRDRGAPPTDGWMPQGMPAGMGPGMPDGDEGGI